MKKLLISLSVGFVLITGCKIQNLVSFRSDVKSFATRDNTIMYKDKPFAQLQAITYTVENGELIKEMNFKLIQKDDLSKVEDMIYYLSQTHEEEVEVEIDMNDTNLFKL